MDRPKRKRNLKEFTNCLKINNESKQICVAQQEEKFKIPNLTKTNSAGDEEEEEEEEEKLEQEEKDEQEKENCRIRDLQDDFINPEVSERLKWFLDRRKEEDYRLIAYINFVIDEGLSENAVDRLDSLMFVLFGEMPPFRKYHIMKAINEIERDMIDKVEYFCGKCGNSKKLRKTKCEKCDSNSKNVMDSVTFIGCNMKKQIEQILKKIGNEIINAHKSIHLNQQRFHLTDVRRFPGYQKKMETFEEFQNYTINLICTISSDGARFKRVSKREVTPMLIRIEGVNVDTKVDGGAMMLTSLSFADGGVKSNLIHKFIRLNMEPFCGRTYTATVENVEYNFRVVVMSYVCDMKEQYSISGLPNWFNETGCSKCTTEGEKKTNGKITYNKFYSSPLRSDDDIRLSAVLGENGFNSNKETPVVFEYIDPTLITIDPFHVRGMGICKMAVEELLKPTKWKSAKLKKDVLPSLTKSIEETPIYTYDYVNLVSPRKLSKLTGREMDKMAQFLAALVGFTNGCENVNMSIFYLGLYHALTFLGSSLGRKESLKTLLDNLYELICSLEPQSITMKWHVFFKHCQQHESEYGTLHTTEPFERAHKSFMTSIHHQTTNSEKILATRFIAKKIYRAKMLSNKHLLHPRVQQHFSKSMKLGEARMPNPSPTSNEVSCLDILPKHRNLISRLQVSPDDKILKRTVVESRMGMFIYCAPDYWKSSNSTMSMITYFDPLTGEIRFGRIELIVSAEERIRFLVNEFQIEPFQKCVEQFDHHNISIISRYVLDSCRAFPTSFGKVTGSFLNIVPSNCVLSPATTTEIYNQTFVKMHR